MNEHWKTTFDVKTNKLSSVLVYRLSSTNCWQYCEPFCCQELLEFLRRSDIHSEGHLRLHNHKQQTSITMKFLNIALLLLLSILQVPSKPVGNNISGYDSAEEYVSLPLSDENYKQIFGKHEHVFVKFFTNW